VILVKKIVNLVKIVQKEQIANHATKENVINVIILVNMNVHLVKIVTIGEIVIHHVNKKHVINVMMI
jgi:hypothetical protein